MEIVGQWYDPVTNEFSEAKLLIKQGIIEASSPQNGDMGLGLKKKYISIHRCVF
ncbi:hypothetical protein [Runella aurantiaca]|uniref:hypothetical protein n=1 Tax=Runella aurantiaca TaxID=2282308 RepID=UPI001314D38C|nr:hypothetical protein [Runella aurantiaca]